MNHQAAVSKTAEHWRELDFLRGLAVVFMALNHTGVVAPRLPASGAVGPLVEAGGFAPVLFFFITGLGYGVQSAGRPAARGHGYLVKVAILLAADSLLWLAPGRHFGNDFFGFIGVSMLLLEWVRRAPRSGVLAAVMAAGVVIVRYAGGPVLRHAFGGHPMATLPLFLAGVGGLSGCSYPPCPWLAYPLLGFVLGRSAASCRRSVEERHGSLVFVLTAAAVAFGVVAAALTARGLEWMRYSGMSLAFFVASLGVLCLSLAVVLVVCRPRTLKPLVDLVSLSGIRSFAFVPLHYALIPVCAALIGGVGDTWSYLRNASVVIVAAFAGSAVVPAAASAVCNSERGRRLAWALVVAAYTAACLGLAGGWLTGTSALAVRTAVQLSLSLLLVVPLTLGVRPLAQARTLQRSQPLGDRELTAGSAAS